jgi:CRISPR-associated endonuclease Cas2
VSVEAASAEAAIRAVASGAPEFEENAFSPRRIRGASAAEDRYYVIVAFDISEPKKYRQLIKILGRYSQRIQKSIFEAWLRRTQISQMAEAIENLMGSERFFCESDNVCIYRIAGNCDATVFGEYSSVLMDENIFL